MFGLMNVLKQCIPEKFPFFETLLLMVLALITIFRRRLSSNDEYRLQFQQKSRSITMISKKRSYASNTAISTAFSDKLGNFLADLSAEVLIHFSGYLQSAEIVQLTAVSKNYRRIFRSDSLWEQLWIQTYGRMWQDANIRELREGRGIYWDPMLNFGPPQQGWQEFFLMFEICWIDWVLAGYCTNKKCLVGIRESVYDLTTFVDDHPGSPETLSEGSGCDATEVFEEIGHSTFAEHILQRFLVWDSVSNGPPKRFSGAVTSCTVTNRKHSPNHNTRLSQEMKKNKKIMTKLGVDYVFNLKKNSLMNTKSIHRMASNLIAKMRISFLQKNQTSPLSAALMQFSGLHPVVSNLEGFYECSSEYAHFAQPKACFDPLSQEWTIWWSCCGQGQILVESSSLCT